MLVHLPREDGYRPKHTVKNGPGARRLRSGHDEERAHHDDEHAARPAAPLVDVGPRQGTLGTCIVHRRDRHPGLLRRPPQPLAASHQREHERSLAAVLPNGTDLSRWNADEIEAVATALKQATAEDPRLEDARRGPR